MKVHNAIIHSFIQKGQDNHSYYINMVLYFILKYTLKYTQNDISAQQ